MGVPPGATNPPPISLSILYEQNHKLYTIFYNKYANTNQNTKRYTVHPHTPTVKLQPIAWALGYPRGLLRPLLDSWQALLQTEGEGTPNPAGNIIKYITM